LCCILFFRYFSPPSPRLSSFQTRFFFYIHHHLHTLFIYSRPSSPPPNPYPNSSHLDPTRPSSTFTLTLTLTLPSSSSSPHSYSCARYIYHIMVIPDHSFPFAPPPLDLDSEVLPPLDDFSSLDDTLGDLTGDLGTLTSLELPLSHTLSPRLHSPLPDSTSIPSDSSVSSRSLSSSPTQYHQEYFYYPRYQARVLPRRARRSRRGLRQTQGRLL